MIEITKMIPKIFVAQRVSYFGPKWPNLKMAYF
jgi:hypothetical protein